LFIVITALITGSSIGASDSDQDGDGLTDKDEKNQYHTNISNPDTDGDVLTDGEEVYGSHGFKTNPLKSDTDDDGLDDRREIWWACDPTDPYTKDISIKDGELVDKRLDYPYANIGDKDSDQDGLPFGAESYEIDTSPDSRSTDGDRYSDGMEYFGHQGAEDLPGYVERNPLMPSTPDIGISVDPNIKVNLAKSVVVGGEEIHSGEQTISSESSAGISTTLAIETEISSQVDVGYPPWESSASATAAVSLNAAIETTATLRASKESIRHDVSVWKEANYVDLSNSKLSTNVKIKNIGNDMLTSKIGELYLNCYLGADKNPFYTWKLLNNPTEITNLMPGREANIRIEIPIDFDEYTRFASGEALTIAVDYYSFGDDQQWLENAKSRCAIIDVDYGDGICTRHYVAISRNKDITLYDAYNTFGDMILSHDDENTTSMYITSIDGKGVFTGKPPYKWWSINFQKKTKEDIPANFTTTVLHPGDHLLLEYKMDTDGDRLSDKDETLLGTDKGVNDTDGDGLTDGDETLLYHTDPRLRDTDGDGVDDGSKVPAFEDLTISVSSWDCNRLDIWVRGADNSLMHRWWNGLEWSDWVSSDRNLTSAPAAVSCGDNRINVLARGPDNTLMHGWWDGSKWSGLVQQLGGNLTSAPAVSSWDCNRLDIFVRGTDNSLMHRWWDGSKLSGWESLGGNLTSAPAAVSLAPNAINVFAKGPDNKLIHKWWDGSKWSDWQQLDGNVASAPTVSSWGYNRLDIFVRGTDNSLMHRWWDGSKLSGWVSLGGNLTSAPAAGSCGYNRINVFAKGPDNKLIHKWWDGSKWSDWQTLDPLIP